MKVYFGASVTVDRTLLPQYQLIVKEIEKLGHTVLSDYVVDKDLVPGDGLTSEELFAREIEVIRSADVMIAEVSVPSWGTAFLMEHALDLGKSVLTLFYKETEYDLPMMIQGHPGLYVEHYDEEDVHVSLKRYFDFVGQMKKRSGKLVVIDGGDGSGKSTQRKLLLKYLKDHSIAFRQISFPRYETSFHGKHVGRFLKGEFGGNNEVSPYLSSLTFALDRLTARKKMIDWLDEGFVVVVDRYVSASMAHQGSKLSGIKQQEFLEWLYNMEYKEHRLPKEDLVLYLYVPVEVAQMLLSKGREKIDAVDQDVKHQKRSIAMYRKLVKKYPHWEMITCVGHKKKLLSIEEIHKKIINLLKRRGILASD